MKNKHLDAKQIKRKEKIHRLDLKQIIYVICKTRCVTTKLYSNTDLNMN